MAIQNIQHAIIRNLPLYCSTAFLFATGLITPANAQTSVDTQQGVRQGLPDIVVTARRREESLQDTPISITAFNADALKNRSIVTLDKIVEYTPNVSSYTAGGSSASPSVFSTYIRGIGQSDFILTADPGVGIYVDGVYIARPLGSILDLVDVERVEVLRGPQGTLFGKNTIGGGINVTTRRPSDEVTGSLELIGGSYERLDARGYLSGPISSTLSGKVAVAYKTLGGYGKRLSFPDGATLDKTGQLDDLTVRAGLSWKPADALTIDSAFDYTRLRDSLVPETVEINPNGTLLSFWNALVGGPAGTPITTAYETNSRFNNYATGPNRSDQDVYGGRITATLAWDDTQLKSITGYRTLDSVVDGDGDGVPQVYQSAFFETDAEQISQEFQLLGEGDRFNYVIGAYYFRERGTESFVGRAAAGLWAALEALPGAVIPLGPVACPAPPPAPCAGSPGNPLNTVFEIEIGSRYRTNAESYAAFAQGSFSFTEQLTGTLGLRYTDETKDFTSIFNRKLGSGLPVIPDNRKLSNSFTSTSPKIGLEYRPQDDLMFYGSVAQGFKSGGYNGRALTPGGLTVFDPETVWSYELGFKLDAMNRSVRLNGATFFNEYKDLQLTQVINNPNGSADIIVGNAGDVDVYGGELELQLLPTSRLLLTGSLGYLHSEYTRIQASAVPADSELPNAPEWTINLGAEYTVPVEFGELRFGAQYNYRSSYYIDTANTERFKQEGFGLLNARIAYQDEVDRWTVAVFGTNLTDEDYISIGTNTGASLGQDKFTKGGRPQEWGVSIGYRF